MELGAVWQPCAMAAAERVYVAIDLETTGLDAASDSIIEIRRGALPGRELERFDQLIKPQSRSADYADYRHPQQRCGG